VPATISTAGTLANTSRRSGIRSFRGGTSATNKIWLRASGYQFEFGVAVTPAGPGVVCAAGRSGSSFTSLGTMTPFRVSGTTGNPASAADGSALLCACGAGSVIGFEAQAASSVSPTAKITPRPIDITAIPQI
jgi:hypothetical protein